jgi:hypothetical protein
MMVVKHDDKGLITSIQSYSNKIGEIWYSPSELMPYKYTNEIFGQGWEPISCYPEDGKLVTSFKKIHEIL